MPSPLEDLARSPAAETAAPSSTNPLEALARSPKKSPLEALATAPPKTTAAHAPHAPSQRQEPFSPLHAIANVAGRAPEPVKKVASGALDLGFKGLDLIDRPRQTSQAAIAAPWGHKLEALARTLAHGASQKEQDANRAQTRASIAGLLHDPGFVDRYAADPQVGRGLLDFLVDTVTDPVVPLGATGAIEQLVNTGGKAALYGAIKGAGGAQRAAEAALTSKPVLAAAKFTRGGEALDPTDVSRAVKNAGKVTGAAFDAVTPRGRVTRKAIEHAPFDPKKPLSSIAKPFADVDAVSTIKNRTINTQRGVSQAAQKLYDGAVKDLTAEERTAVFRAIDKGIIDTLPERLRAPATTIADLYKGVLHLQGARTVRRDLADAGFVLPEELKPFDTSVRGIFTRQNVRPAYLPHGREFANADLAEIRGESRPGLTEEDLLGRPPTTSSARSATRLDDVDPHKKHRADVSGLQDVDRQNEINRARFATAGRSIAGRDAARSLADQFGAHAPVMRAVREEKPDVGEIYRAATSGLNAADRSTLNKLINGAKIEGVSKNLADRAKSITDAINYRPEVKHVATGATRADFSTVPGYLREHFLRDAAPKDEPGGLLARFVRAAADAPKYGFFFNPLRHMANITTLGALSDPGSTATAVGRFAAAHPEFSGTVAGAGVGGYEDGWQGALAGGAAGLAGGRALRKLTPATKAALASEERAIQDARRAGASPINPEEHVPGLIASTPGLRQAYSASNRTLWRYDEAVKAARYNALIKSGMDPATAAQRVGQDLIDYSSKSALSRAAAYAMPFSNYRTKLPGAVARAVVRHPERALTADRLAPSQAGRDQDTGFGDGSTLRGYLPLSDVVRGANAPEEYLRSSLSYPYRDAASALGMGRLDPWWTPPAKSSPAQAESERHFMTYGQQPKDVLLSELLGSVPGGDEALTALDLNPFTKSAEPYKNALDAAKALLKDQVQSSTGTRIRPPARSQGQAAMERMIRSEYGAQIALAKKAGKEAVVADLKKREDAALKRVAQVFASR